MNTRRAMTFALLGLPLLGRSEEINEQPVFEPKPVPPPSSEAAASIISYTIYAEARGEPVAGKMAVASVINTRAARAKKSMAEICLQNKQFTCWNGLNAVPEFYITGQGIQSSDIKARAQCYGLAWVLIADTHEWDYLTHFYNPDKATPAWAYSLKGTRIIGRHVFGYID